VFGEFAMWKWVMMGVLGGAVAMGGCSDQESAKTDSLSAGADRDQGADNNSDPGAGNNGAFAIPQDVLAKMEDAIKLSGTITITDYSSGLIQIDVTKAIDGDAPTQGVPPISVARFKSPGPFELFLPPETESVNLTLILDVEGDGPGSGDPQLSYDKNPVAISGSEVTGIDFLLEKIEVESQPSPPPDRSAGDAQAKATEDAADGASPEAAPATDASSTETSTGTEEKSDAAKAVADKATVPDALSKMLEGSASEHANSDGDSAVKSSDPLDESQDTLPKSE